MAKHPDEFRSEIIIEQIYMNRGQELTVRMNTYTSEREKIVEPDERTAENKREQAMKLAPVPSADRS